VTEARLAGQSSSAVPSTETQPERPQGLESVRAEPEKFRALYDANVAFVWRSLARLGAHSTDLEDLAHDVFLVAWRRTGTYDPARPIRPWLFGIAVRVFANHRRSLGRRREVAVAPAGDREPRTPDPAGRQEARDLVLHALAALDLDQRAVLCLHDIEGATMPEVAAALGIALNTGYSRLRLARAAFSRAVRRLRVEQPALAALELADEPG
jgi:RNA polymerase sigma-70 factor (ECF subfamily)